MLIWTVCLIVCLTQKQHTQHGKTTEKPTNDIANGVLATCALQIQMVGKVIGWGLLSTYMYVYYPQSANSIRREPREYLQIGILWPSKIMQSIMKLSVHFLL